jgi:phosphate transport system permease protein
MRSGGILPALVGTLWLTLGTAIAAVPVGLGAAIYLAEYAPDNADAVIRVAIINLADPSSTAFGLGLLCSSAFRHEHPA